MNSLLKESTKQEIFSGITTDNKSTKVSHLQFADDTIFISSKRS